MTDNEPLDKIEAELESISRQAFRMAVSVHRDAGLRARLAGEAGDIRSRLLDISEHLDRIDLAAKKKWFHSISESLLDLDYVLAARDVTSIRLGDLMRWG
ncbi:MAG TPA: hypothetical protein VK654_04395 [Nitrospirota bacterium]|nr:hypothetical protein [Nitrospirota bacterium]